MRVFRYAVTAPLPRVTAPLARVDVIRDHVLGRAWLTALEE
jgi:hypothetical protein